MRFALVGNDELKFGDPKPAKLADERSSTACKRRVHIDRARAHARTGVAWPRELGHLLDVSAYVGVAISQHCERHQLSVHSFLDEWLSARRADALNLGCEYIGIGRQ